MRCAQIRHIAFFKRLGVLGAGLGGAEPPPQGPSPNDMVVCVCDLPYWVVFRRCLWVLGLLWGSRKEQLIALLEDDGMGSTGNHAGLDCIM